MLTALITLSIVALVELAVIWQLINRLLQQAGQQPLRTPSLPSRSDQPPDLPQSEQPRRKVMSIPFVQ